MGCSVFGKNKMKMRYKTNCYLTFEESHEINDKNQ